MERPEALKVFISYARRDSQAFAEELVGGLEIAGFDPRLDIHDIAKGEDWVARLGNLIQEADTVLFVISPESIKSERCEWEIERTLTLAKRLIPVVHIDVPEAEVPEKLRRLNYTFFSGGRSFTRALAEVCEALRFDQEWVREHTRLGELAARWLQRGKPEELLLRGVQLEEATTWLGNRREGAPEVSPEHTAFLQASREATLTRAAEERKRLEDLVAAQTARAKAVARVVRVTRFGLVIVSALGLVAAYNWYEARVQEERASLQRNRAEEALAIANTNAEDVVFSVAGAIRSSTGVPQSVARDILGKTAQLLDQLPPSPDAPPHTLRTRAMALLELGGSLAEAGRLRQAADVARRANELLNRLTLIDPSPDRTFDNVLGLELSASIDADLSRLDEAKRTLDTVVEKLSALVALPNVQPKWRTALANALDNLATFSVADGDLEASVNLLRQALNERMRLHEEKPQDTDHERALLLSRERLAGMLAARGDYVTARSILSETVGLRQEIVRLSRNALPLLRELAFAHELLGDVLLHDGKPADAKQRFLEALKVRRQIARGDDDHLWRIDIAQALSYLGHASVALGEEAEAKRSYDEALEIHRTIASEVEAEEGKGDGGLGRLTANALSTVAWSALLARDFDLALTASERALTLDTQSPSIKLHHAHALLFSGRIEEARRAYAGIAPVKTLSSSRIPAVSGLANDFRQLRLAGLERDEMQMMLQVRSAR